MVIKTKSRKKTQVKKSKRKKVKRTKWLGLSLEEALHSTMMDDFKFKTGNQHELETSSKKNYTYLDDKYANAEVLRCKRCGSSFVGMAKDKYEPPAYNLYSKIEEESAYTCTELCVKDIIQ